MTLLLNRHHWSNLAVVVFCAALGSLQASGAEHPVLHNTKRVLKARQALYEDPLLAPYNLGVELRDDVATLSGTLPDTALALRAQERVRNLGLFKEVHNELMIDPACNQPLQLPRETPSAPIPALKLPIAETTPSNGATTSGLLSDSVTLLPPRPIDLPKKAPTEAVAVILPPRPITAMDPSAAVEQLRRSEARYWSLQVGVREGVVTIRGDGKGEELFAFAQAVRLLPGVVRVVLDPTP